MPSLVQISRGSVRCSYMHVGSTLGDGSQAFLEYAVALETSVYVLSYTPMPMPGPRETLFCDSPCCRSYDRWIVTRFVRLRSCFANHRPQPVSSPSPPLYPYPSSTQTFHGGQDWAHLSNFVEDFSVTTNGLGTPEAAVQAAYKAVSTAENNELHGTKLN